jgi:hypothetical protein
MAKREDVASAVDDETMALVKGGYQPRGPKPASGEKLIRQLESEAAARRDGKGR